MHQHSLQLNLRSMQNIQIPVFVEPDTIAVRWVSFAVNSIVVHEVSESAVSRTAVGSCNCYAKHRMLLLQLLCQ